MMDTLNSDLVWHIAQYASVVDAAAWMQTSQRYYYLIHQLRRVLGPEMVARAGGGIPLNQLRQRPTLALCCNTPRSTFGEKVAAQLPNSTVILGAISSSIQTCLPPDGAGATATVESKSPSNILVGNLGPEATIQPFHWQSEGQRGMDWATVEPQVVEAFAASTDYEVFLIYACGDGCDILEEFVECVQSLHPEAALVGGICSSGYVSKAVDQEVDRGVLSSKRVAVLKQMYKNLGGCSTVLKTLIEKQTLVEHVHALLQNSPFVLEPHLEDAVFGVALAGNVPIRSVVSRGVQRLTPPDTTLLVREARLLGPTVGHDWQTRQPRTIRPAFHVVDSLLDKDTGKEFNLMSFLAHNQTDNVDFCGVRRSLASGQNKYEHAFELYAMDLHGDKLKIPTTNSDLFTSHRQQGTAEGEETMEGAQIDFFALHGPSCVQHVESTMRQLKHRVEQDDDQVLAAIMYSCGGRGPEPGWLIRKSMADANAFSTAFEGQVPCIGFYAGGEVGPLATAPAEDTTPTDNTLFQRGKAALQGFTAVFALFIAPKVDLKQVDIDDSPNHVSEFISKQLGVEVAAASSS